MWAQLTNKYDTFPLWTTKFLWALINFVGACAPSTLSACEVGYDSEVMLILLCGIAKSMKCPSYESDTINVAT